MIKRKLTRIIIYSVYSDEANEVFHFQCWFSNRNLLKSTVSIWDKSLNIYQFFLKKYVHIYQRSDLLRQSALRLACVIKL